jgi:transcriptional regulator with XRE-family HTH domain
MFENEIINIGDKVKRIRKMLGATQDEIAEGLCTKNRISQIENNRKKLNFNLAIGIAENFNKIVRDKNMDISLFTAEELMKDEDSQANDIFSHNILVAFENIKSIDKFEEKLNEAEDLIEKYNIIDKSKIELYKLAAEFYYYNHKYHKSDEVCNKGLKICFNSKNFEEEVNFYIYKSRNSITTVRYQESLEQLEYAENLNNTLKKSNHLEMILYQKALTYKKLDDYRNALRCFELLKEKCEIKDVAMLLKVKMVYANCLNESHIFEQSKIEYIEILDIAMKMDNKAFIIMTYRNLSELYFNERDYKTSAEYIKKSLELNPSNEYINENFYFAAKVLKHLNEDTEPYLLKALDICEKNDRENLDLIEKIIYELILIYIQNECELQINIMIKKIDELNIDYNLSYPRLVEYYRYRNPQKSVELNEKLIKKNELDKKII